MDQFFLLLLLFPTWPQNKQYAPMWWHHGIQTILNSNIQVPLTSVDNVLQTRQPSQRTSNTKSFLSAPTTNIYTAWLVLMDTWSGKRSWIQKSIQHRLFSPPSSTSDVPSLDAVTVCSVDGILYIINIVNGEILAKHHFPGKTFSSPCVVNNKILVGCRDNSLYCLTIKFDEL